VVSLIIKRCWQVNTLARVGNGEPEFIVKNEEVCILSGVPMANPVQIASKVIRQLGRALQPSLTNVAVNWASLHKTESKSVLIVSASIEIMLMLHYSPSPSWALLSVLRSPRLSSRISAISFMRCNCLLWRSCRTRPTSRSPPAATWRWMAPALSRFACLSTRRQSNVAFVA
jgi:hypothetical protein